MKLYSLLRRKLSPRAAAFVTGAWYAVLLFLIFIGLSQQGIDLRYANL